MADEAYAGGQSGYELGVDAAGDVNACKGAVDCLYAVEGAGLALLKELGAVGGLWLDDLGDLGEGCPGVVGALGVVFISFGSVRLVEMRKRDIGVLVG